MSRVGGIFMILKSGALSPIVAARSAGLAIWRSSSSGHDAPPALSGWPVDILLFIGKMAGRWKALSAA